LGSARFTQAATAATYAAAAAGATRKARERESLFSGAELTAMSETNGGASLLSQQSCQTEDALDVRSKGLWKTPNIKAGYNPCLATIL